MDAAGLIAQAYFELVAANAYREGRDVNLNWVRQRLTGTNVEPAAMEGTFDLTTMQQSVGEQGFGVSADVASRIELVADTIERHLNASDLHAHRLPVPQFTEQSRRVPIFVHRHCLSSYAVEVERGRSTIIYHSATSKGWFCLAFSAPPFTQRAPKGGAPSTLAFANPRVWVVPDNVTALGLAAHRAHELAN